VLFELDVKTELSQFVATLAALWLRLIML